MDEHSLVGAIGRVNSMWSIAAFAIAAVLVAMKLLLAPPAASASRRGRKPPAILSNGVLWPVVAVIGALAVLPILAHTYLESQRVDQLSIVRVRVTTIGPDGRPLSGATLRATATNETTTTAQGAGIITIPTGALPADRKVTIYADLESGFLHGRTDLQVGGDPNPSVTIALNSTRDATVTGLVEDASGRTVAGARVTVLGGESGETAADGTFTLKTNTPPGQMVRLHAEKRGYNPVDQDHPAGRTPVTIVLPR